MKNKHSDLDSLFRKNIPDYEFSERKGNWELLNHLLKEQQRKKKTIRVVKYIFSLLILVSTAFFFL